MQAKSIEEVISQLEVIIEECISNRSRLGYFAALYNRVTQSVREGIRQGEFLDGPRMERLDVMFANRYLTAYSQYKAGELPSRSWLKAFEAAGNPDLVVLQHLLIGMNAHINLDLAVAAARTSPGNQLAPLEPDFNRINTVLAALTPLVEQEIDQESPVFRWLTKIAPSLELKAVGFAMDEAREAAWHFANKLAFLTAEQQVSAMASRDMEVAILGDLVLARNPLFQFIHSDESTDVAENIRILAKGEFKIAVPTEAVPVAKVG
ncbi:DUF5995 family protein [Hyalangium versicolor]|uniref:DUF5995 family protein n=1 Tax=Hyalangium versicolor TaxID=2861190 RepID=UPI001CCDE20C|nr:DUF5995 family protein [Hyalangium versicolor]